MANVINPYQNQEMLTHRKFVSHLGIAYLDLKYVEKQFLSRPRTVLRKICGQLNYGTLVAILGPQKSGKTTLLKCLCGRANEGIDVDTEFYLNQDIAPDVIYLEKDINSNMLVSLTVEETLIYAFCFRNQSNRDRLLVIKELIKDLELNEIRDMQIRSCSTEEQVRVLIGMALSTDNKPNMIFMDEPLDILDAVGVENIVSLMKRICRNYSITIACSAGHIPDSDILTIFDKLYVLSRGGLCIYEGSVDHLALFLRESDLYITSKIQTPIERLMKIAAKPDQATIRLANRVFSTHDEISDMGHRYGTLSPNGIQTRMAGVNIGNMFNLFGRSLIHKYRIYWKSILFYHLMMIGISFTLANAFNNGIGIPDSCYNKTSNFSFGQLVVIDESVSRDTVDSVSNKNIEVIYGKHLVDENLKFLFVICIGLSLFQIVTSIMILNEEIKVAINEHRNGWHSISSFYLIKNLVEMIVPIVNTSTCILICYLMTDQILVNWRFMSVLYAQLSGVLCAQGFGFLIGIIAVFNNRFTSSLIIVSYVIMVVFAGYLIPLAESEYWIKSLANISYIKQVYELTLLSIYGMGRCDKAHSSQSYVLNQFDISYPEAYLRNSAIILSYFLLFRLIVWIILIKKANKQVIIKRLIVEKETEEEDPDEMDKGQSNSKIDR